MSDPRFRSDDFARDRYLKHFWRRDLGYLSAADYLERRNIWVTLLHSAAMIHCLPVPLPDDAWMSPWSAESVTWNNPARDELLKGIGEAITDWDNGAAAHLHFEATPGHDYAGDRDRLRKAMADYGVPPAYVTEPMYCSGLVSVVTDVKLSWPRADVLEHCAKMQMTAEQIEQAERTQRLWWDQPDADLSRLDEWQRLCEWLQKVKWKRFKEPDDLPDDCLRAIMFIPFKTTPRFSESTTEMYQATRLLCWYSSDRRRRKEQVGYGCVPDWKARLADLRAIAAEQQKRKGPMQP